MTYEEAKEVVSDCIKHEGYSCDCKFSRECTSDKKTALKKAFEALGKQIPKRKRKYQGYRCVCGEEVAKNQRYCEYCGQALLDWGEVME